jgi:hypothetical protein
MPVVRAKRRFPTVKSAPLWYREKAAKPVENMGNTEAWN